MNKANSLSVTMLLNFIIKFDTFGIHYNFFKRETYLQRKIKINFGTAKENLNGIIYKVVYATTRQLLFRLKNQF